MGLYWVYMGLSGAVGRLCRLARGIIMGKHAVLHARGRQRVQGNYECDTTQGTVPTNQGATMPQTK